MRPDRHAVPRVAVGNQRCRARRDIVAIELVELLAAAGILPEDDRAPVGGIELRPGELSEMPSGKNVSWVRARPGPSTRWSCGTLPNAVWMRICGFAGFQATNCASRKLAYLLRSSAIAWGIGGSPSVLTLSGTAITRSWAPATHGSSAMIVAQNM